MSDVTTLQNTLDNCFIINVVSQPFKHAIVLIRLQIIKCYM